MTFSAQFDYARTFAKYHNVAATFIGWGYQTQNSADEIMKAVIITVPVM